MARHLRAPASSAPVDSKPTTPRHARQPGQFQHVPPGGPNFGGTGRATARRQPPRGWRAGAAATALLAAAVIVVVGSASNAGSTPSAAGAYHVVSRIAYDPLQRNVRAGFGAADVGGSYKTLTAASQFSVRPGTGRVGPVSPGKATGASLAAVSAADERVQINFSVPQLATAGSGTYVSAEIRKQANGDAYRARVRVAPNGQLRISLAKFVNGQEVVLRGGAEVAVASQAKAGQRIILEGQATGSGPVRLAVHAWISGAKVPTWQYELSDASPGPLARGGGVGLYLYQSAQSGSAQLDLHVLTAWRVATAAPATSPSQPVTNPPTTPTTSTAPTATRTAPASPPTTAPSTSAATTTPPPAPSTAGAAPLGSADYSVPAGAIFVSPTGSDTGSGALGSPYATLAHAVSAAPAGATIVMRAGHYDEDVFIGKALTIQNYPGEVAWMDGSIPVSGWTQSGSRWVHSGWNYQFDSSASFSQGSDAGGFVNSAHPLAAHPDQVFFDDQQLEQVAANPGPGQFSVDYAAKTITVGSSPSGHAVRASNLQQAFVVGAGGVTIRGIGVRGYATSLWQMGAIYLGGSAGGDVLSNLVIADNATQGLSLDTPRVVVNHVSAQANGMTGIHANASPGSTIENSSVTGNNTQRFNNAPATAGIKISRLDRFTVRNNDVTGNPASNGIWTDENVTNFVITGNTVRDNGEYGILTELSDTGIVADNYVATAKYGYTAFDTGNVKVFNNAFRNNSVWDLGLSQDNRYQPGKSTAGVQPTPADPWLVRNIVAADNDFTGATGLFEFYVLDKQTNRPADSMNITVDGNLFLTRSGSSGSWPVGWGGSDNTTVTTYATGPAFDSAKGKGSTNESVAAGVASPPAGSTQSYAVPLPADVATAVGVAAGTQHVGRF